MNAPIEIKPCPFCDHDDVEIGEIELGSFAVDCPECQCIGPFGNSPWEAIALWNVPHSKNFALTHAVSEARELSATNVAIQGAEPLAANPPSGMEGSTP